MGANETLKKGDWVYINNPPTPVENCDHPGIAYEETKLLGFPLEVCGFQPPNFIVVSSPLNHVNAMLDLRRYELDWCDQQFLCDVLPDRFPEKPKIELETKRIGISEMLKQLGLPSPSSVPESDDDFEVVDEPPATLDNRRKGDSTDGEQS